MHNPHVPNLDDKPGEDYWKVIYVEKPDRTYVKGTILKKDTGAYVLTGTFKTSSGVFKNDEELLDPERTEIINEFEQERAKVDAEYTHRPPSNDLHGCDEDADRDGVTNSSDNCPAYGGSNPSQADGDCDLVGDACDNCPATYNPNQADSDLDGIGDDCEAGGTVASQYSQSLPFTIPDNNPTGASATIQVPTSGTIAALDVQLQINHPRQSDLVVELAHAGTIVKLLYRAGTSQPFAGCGPAAVGYSAANFGSVGNPLVLDDCAPAVVDCYDGEGNGIAGYHGPAHANRLLQAFSGLDKSGSWTLRVFDEVAGNSGVLNSWSLLFDELPVPSSSGVPTLSFVGLLSLIIALLGAAIWVLLRRG